MPRRPIPLALIPLALIPLALGSCGIPDDTLVSELSEEEWTQLCETELEALADDTIFTCDDGSTVSVGGRSTAECATIGSEEFGGCEVPVDDYVTCYNTIVTDPCSDLEAACAEVTEICG